MSEEARRPLKSRRIKFFHTLAAKLVKFGLTPNQVSTLSMVFAAAGATALRQASLMVSPLSQVLVLALALLGVQLRLLCNLIDGLMAVEGGLKTSYGELFNDFPDRVSDLCLILGAGFAIADLFPAWPIDGFAWFTAILAIFTAYIRVLGASMGAGHFFSGPMAKQHRMFILSLGILASMVEVANQGKFRYSLFVALAVIAAGSFVTCIRRLRLVVKASKAQTHASR